MLMLAVMRMDVLDFHEARGLIQTACAIAGWQHPLYRQNYGLLLSAYIPHAVNEENLSGARPEQQSFSTLKRELRRGGGGSLNGVQLGTIAGRISASFGDKTCTALREDGFDVIGYARSESGIAENMRALARSCNAAQLCYSIIDIDTEAARSSDLDFSFKSHCTTAPEYRHQIICLNPDALALAAHYQGADSFANAYKIGYWFWELERVPPSWNQASTAMQELWAGSEFVRRALARAVSIPVYTVPPSIVPRQPSRPYARSEFGLTDDDFVFLFSFSYKSYVTRKNPSAIVRAFQEAFPVSSSSFTRAKLVIKTIHSQAYERESAALRGSAANDPRIIFLDRTLSRDEVIGLQHAADCYVSLHRSEGFGLGMAESMAIGKPVIATGYSANLDFMNEANSLLVDYSLIPVDANAYPDALQQVWADADVECAARHMRAVFDDAALRARLSSAAKEFMHMHYSPATVGAQVRSHLQRLNRHTMNSAA